MKNKQDQGFIKELSSTSEKPKETKTFVYSKPVVKPFADSLNTIQRMKGMKESKAPRNLAMTKSVPRGKR